MYKRRPSTPIYLFRLCYEAGMKRISIFTLRLDGKLLYLIKNTDEQSTILPPFEQQNKSDRVLYHNMP